MKAPAHVPAADSPVAGILFITGAMAMFAIMDAHAKYLGQAYPVLMVLWARYFFHFVLVVAIFHRRLPSLVQSQRRDLQILRGVIALVATGLAFLSLKTLALADMVALAFLAPIFVTIFAVPLLGERVGIRRWLAVLVGFCGMLIIVRPGLSVFEPASLLVVGAAVLMALFVILTRKISRHASTARTVFYQALVGSLIMCAALPFIWVTPTWTDALLMVSIGVFGGTGQILLVSGYERAPASSVAPIAYTELIWAALLGFLVFGNLPDVWTVVGASVIVASGLYIANRERRAASAARRRAAG